MKDNISIIFAALIGTLLIVILPLYSILDRQDSMSYNVVLTATCDFVDTVRNNGFIDKDTYYEYISKLASTSNTYKVDIEAYKKTLIHATDEEGNVIKDTYEEETELYNTLDILNVIEGNTVEDTSNANTKNNIYLLDVNDEIYVKVYNTNTTMGSIMYSFIANTANTKVINVSYGGLVQKVNWELYDKLNETTKEMPEVILGVPTNENGATNIYKVDTNEACEEIDEETGEIINVCEEANVSESNKKYVYRYDLTKEENKTINVSVELKNIDEIFVSDNKSIKLSEMTEEDFEAVKKYILDVNDRKIVLSGIEANIDLKWRGPSDYYLFNIVLTDVRMSSLLYFTDVATITVLPGIGKGEDGTLSLGASTVELEVMNEDASHKVEIYGPIIWQKALKAQKTENANVIDSKVYVNEEIAFVVEYLGINRETADIVKAIRENLRINENAEYYTDLEILSKEDLKNRISISSNQIIVKFKYTKDSNEINYVSLPEAWIETDLEEIVDTDVEGFAEVARGAKSSEYLVELDNYTPVEPSILLEGTKGNNGWFVSKVNMSILPSTADRIGKIDASGKEVETIGGSGVWKNTYIVSGAKNIAETEYTSGLVEIDKNGTSTVTAYAYDYAGNKSNAESKVLIDTERPTAPTVKVIEGTKGENNWYLTNVRLQITAGTDKISGVDKTTYKVEGAGEVEETTVANGGIVNIKAEGKSVVTVTTYDKAGNKTETKMDINIDTVIPKEANITVISGTKGENDWYTTDVTLRITLDVGEAVSGVGTSKYRILGTDETGELRDFTGDTLDVTIDKDGTFELIVYTYSAAGNYKQKSYTVKIDKTKPNNAIITLDIPNDRNWYRTNAIANIRTGNDSGKQGVASGLKEMTYTLTNKDTGVVSVEKVVKDNDYITFKDEGRFVFTVYSIDNAGNRSEISKDINIDKTNPLSAEFKIDGIKGKNNWYTSDVKISYTGGNDSLSGIKEISLTKTDINYDTDKTGEEIILLTIDNAGNYIEKSVIIKVDKTKPTAPIIDTGTPTGQAVYGVVTYNKNVNVKITEGIDTNRIKTTYEVTKNDGQVVVIPETTGTNFTITEEGTMTITARTYDEAGNVTEAKKTIMINKTKPLAPVIYKINDIDVRDEVTKTVTTNKNTAKITFKRVGTGTLTITLINETTGKSTTVTKTINSEDITVDVTLDSKAKYSIIATQTNLYGTTSDNSSGAYYIEYK